MTRAMEHFDDTVMEHPPSLPGEAINSLTQPQPLSWESDGSLSYFPNNQRGLVER